MAKTGLCTVCHEERELSYTFQGDRVCKRCYSKHAHRAICTRCNKDRRIVRRIDGQPICPSCWMHDPSRTKPCTRCGDIAMVAGRVDGNPYCQLCYKKPTAPCSSCGEVRTVQSRRTGAPVCKRCYDAHRAGKEISQIRRIQPAGERRRRVCSKCNVERLCTGFLSPKPVCSECRGRAPLPCTGCHSQRPVHAYWPGGPVCKTCYDAYMESQRVCVVCQEKRLVVPTEFGNRCRTCLDAPALKTCLVCNKEAKIYADEFCLPCYVAEIALFNLTMDRKRTGADLRLKPVIDILAKHPNPRSILGWIRRSPGTAIIRSIANYWTEISHEGLDSWIPQIGERHVDFVRSLFISAGLLESQDNVETKIDAWLQTSLVDLPEDTAGLINAYARWHLVRTLRKSQRRGALAQNSIRWAQSRLRAAITFCGWIRSQNSTIAECNQGHVDLWLSTGKTTRYLIRDFVRWINKGRDADPLIVPARKTQDPGQIFDEQVHWALVRKLFDDDTIDREMRIIGAWLMAFGQQLSRICSLTTDVISEKGALLYVQFGKEPIEMPPIIATLLREQRAAALLNPKSLNADGRHWLFPGQNYGQHISVSNLENRIRDLDLFARRGRNSAFMKLAGRIHPAIIARMFNMHVGTAVVWAKAAGHDYNAHVARKKQILHGR